MEEYEHDSRAVCCDDVTCLRETDSALLVEMDGEEYWIPKSQVHDDGEVYEEGGTGLLVITLWIAKQNGLV